MCRVCIGILYGSSGVLSVDARQSSHRDFVRADVFACDIFDYQITPAYSALVGTLSINEKGSMKQSSAQHLKAIDANPFPENKKPGCKPGFPDNKD